MARSQEPQMTSPYLDRPLLPLALALPRMLQEIEAALAAAPWEVGIATREDCLGHSQLAPDK